MCCLASMEQPVTPVSPLICEGIPPMLLLGPLIRLETENIEVEIICLFCRHSHLHHGDEKCNVISNDLEKIISSDPFYSRFHKNRTGLKIATLDREPVSTI